MPNRPSSYASKEQRAVDAARRMTARDRAILFALFDYKILLTEQIRVLFFRSLRRCQDRLRELADMELIEKWHPPQPRSVGKAPGHWFLREPGARIVAAMKRVSRSRLPWMPRETLVNDVYLPHRLSVNAFFCALIEASIGCEGHGLQEWKTERTVRTRNGSIRHDGFGCYLHPSGACSFYLEYDRGTETRSQLADKLTGYVTVARDWTEEGTHHFPNLLFVVPTRKREQTLADGLRDLLASDDWGVQADELPFFAASEELLVDRGMLGRVWAPLWWLEARWSIVELPAQEGTTSSLSDCLGRYWTEEAADREARIMPTWSRLRFPAGAPPKDAEGRFRSAGESVSAERYVAVEPGRAADE